MNHFLKKLTLFLMLFSFTIIIAQDSAVKRQLNRMNSAINSQNAHIDSLDIQIRMLLPELQSALKANLNAKEQTDSVAILLINRINTIQNKMRLIEDKISYVDSVNFEILSQLVMVENKIITLTNSFTDMYDIKSNKANSNLTSKITPSDYKKRYIDALSSYQNGNYEKAVSGFSGLVIGDPSNDLADNSQ